MGDFSMNLVRIKENISEEEIIKIFCEINKITNVYDVSFCPLGYLIGESVSQDILDKVSKINNITSIIKSDV